MQRIDDRIAALGLFIISFTAWGPNVFGSQAYMLNCIGLAALSFMTRDKLLIIFGCYCAAWFAFIQIAESKGWMPSTSMIQAVDVLTLIMAGYAVYIAIRFGRASVHFWQNCICIIAAGLSCIGLIQYSFVGSATATLGCTNFLAAYLAISGPCFFRRKWWMLLPLILACLWACHTATAILAFFIGLGFFVWGWIGAGVAVIPGVIYWLIFKAPDSLLERATFWMDAVKKLSGHWEKIVFGTGPGILWRTDNMLHSEYFYLLWNFGIIGLVIAAFYIVRSCRNITNPALFASFLAVLVDGIGNHLMHTAPTAFLAVVIFALMDRDKNTEGLSWH